MWIWSLARSLRCAPNIWKTVHLNLFSENFTWLQSSQPTGLPHPTPARLIWMILRSMYGQCHIYTSTAVWNPCIAHSSSVLIANQWPGLQIAYQLTYLHCVSSTPSSRRPHGPCWHSMTTVILPPKCGYFGEALSHFVGDGGLRKSADRIADAFHKFLAQQ